MDVRVALMLICKSCGVTSLMFLGDGGIARGELARGPGIVNEASDEPDLWVNVRRYVKP